MENQKNMKKMGVALIVSLMFHGLVLSLLAYGHGGRGGAIGPMSYVTVTLDADGRMMGKQCREMVWSGHKPEKRKSSNRLHGENKKPLPELKPPVQTRSEQPVSPRVVKDSPAEPDNSEGQGETNESQIEKLAAGSGDAGAGPGSSVGENRPKSSGSSGLFGSPGMESGVCQKASPLYKKNPPPSYPMSARARRLQGTVELNVLVDDVGRVRDLNIRETSGYTVLDRAAMAAVKTWRFEPGKSHSCPIEMWVVVPMVFKLKEA